MDAVGLLIPSSLHLLLLVQFSLVPDPCFESLTVQLVYTVDQTVLFEIVKQRLVSHLSSCLWAQFLAASRQNGIVEVHLSSIWVQPKEDVSKIMNILGVSAYTRRPELRPRPCIVRVKCVGSTLLLISVEVVLVLYLGGSVAPLSVDLVL